MSHTELFSFTNFVPIIENRTTTTKHFRLRKCRELYCALFVNRHMSIVEIRSLPLSKTVLWFRRDTYFALFGLPSETESRRYELSDEKLHSH